MKRTWVCVLLLSFTIFSAVSEKLTLEMMALPVEHGEGPHWDADKNVLYYVDTSNQKAFKLDPKTKELCGVYIDGGPATFIVTVKDDDSEFIIGRNLDLVSMKWDGISNEPSSLTVLSSTDAFKFGNRFNDGKVDASGRLWAGTMGPEIIGLIPHQASFYSFSARDDFKPHKQLSDISISNGIGWNNQSDLMYYIDTTEKAVFVYDFDLKAGKISNGRLFFSLEKNKILGEPDGMAIDRRGDLWVAVFKGGCILHINGKTGKLIEKLNLPVSQVTSCAFGGENLEDLYVTTSRKDLTEEELKKQPLAGALFRIKGLKVPGQRKNNKIIRKVPGQICLI